MGRNRAGRRHDRRRLRPARDLPNVHLGKHAAFLWSGQTEMLNFFFIGLQMRKTGASFADIPEAARAGVTLPREMIAAMIFHCLDRKACCGAFSKPCLADRDLAMSRWPHTAVLFIALLASAGCGDGGSTVAVMPPQPVPIPDDASEGLRAALTLLNDPDPLELAHWGRSGWPNLAKLRKHWCRSC